VAKTSDSISGEGGKMRFDVRRGRSNQIRCQEKKIKSDSLSGEEDKMIFYVRRGR
jgi:hypothetical protein